MHAVESKRSKAMPQFSYKVFEVEVSIEPQQYIQTTGSEMTFVVTVSIDIFAK